VLSIPIHTVTVVATFHRRFTSASTLQFAGKNAGNSTGKTTCKFAGRFATAMNKRAENLANLTNLAKPANLADTSHGEKQRAKLIKLEELDALIRRL
jgi:hypothetical protein